MVCQKTPATEGHYFPSLKQPQFWGLIWSLIEMFQTVDYKEDEASPVHFMTFSKKGRLVIRKKKKNKPWAIAWRQPSLLMIWAATPFLARRICPGCGAKEASTRGQEDMGLGLSDTPLDLLPHPHFCDLPFSEQEQRDTRCNTTSGIIIARCSKRYSCGVEGPSPHHAPFIIFLSSLCHHTWPCW